jgi:hypothetical protein
MTAKELLGVFVRLTGLACLLLSLNDSFYLIEFVVGIPSSATIPLGTTALRRSIMALLALVPFLARNSSFGLRTRLAATTRFHRGICVFSS